MDDSEISGFDDSGVVLDTDLIALARGSVWKKATGARFVRTDASGGVFIGGDLRAGWGARFIGVQYDETDSYQLGIRTISGSRTTVVRARAADGAGNIAFEVGDGTVVAAAFESDGKFRPGADNVRSLGSSGYRWSTVYAGTSTINTSDASAKTVRASREPTPEERAWARAIEIVPYRFNDAIAEKGDAARLHWGVIAQQVYDAGIAAGIADPLAYAFLCRDPETQLQKVRDVGTRQKTEMQSIPTATVEIREGRAIQSVVNIPIAVPVFDHLPMYDAEGQPVVGEVDGARVHLTHPVPVMEEYKTEREVEVPVLDEDEQPVMRWGVRYTELIMFLRACACVDVQND